VGAPEGHHLDELNVTLLFLLACGTSAPPEPTVAPVPPPPVQIGAQQPVPPQPVVQPTPDGVVVDDPNGVATAPPEPPPVREVDQDWLMKPESHVSAPEWPISLVEPGMCGDVTDGGPVSEDGCITDELRCGDNIVGHTVGGIDRYDTEFYEQKHCWPATVKHDEGNERVYRLKMPPGEWRAWVSLYAPCADLNVAAIRKDDDTCPTMEDKIKVCEMSVKKTRVADRIELTTQTPSTVEPIWYVVVEGREKNDGLYSLHVQCAPGLGGPIPRDRLIGGVDP
jgi:hypothetical protein